MSGYPIRSRGIPVLATLTWTSALNKHDVFHKACLRRLWKSVQPTFLLRSHYKGYPNVWVSSPLSQISNGPLTKVIDLSLRSITARRPANVGNPPLVHRCTRH